MTQKRWRTSRDFAMKPANLRDSEGIEHTAEVTAETLHETVALGLTAIRKSSWVEDIADNFEVRVTVRDTPIEHSVAFRKFTQWLEQRGTTPKEIMAKNRIREIPDLPKTSPS